MKSIPLLVPLTVSLILVTATVRAEFEPSSMTTNTITVQKSLTNEAIEDDVTAKLDPVTATTLIVEVGVPLASALFNKVSAWFANNKDKKQQTTQDTPIISNSTINWSTEINQFARNKCYAYIDKKVKENKDKYQEIANQFGGLCDIVTPNGQTASSLFPEYQPQYFSTQTQTTKPLDIKILQGYGANYQGLQIQIEMLDKQNNVIETRPAQANFKSGERFRLKVTPTFSGFLQIKNIDSNGKTVVLFPKPPVQFFQLNAGETMLLPTNPKGFYEFDTQTGTEQLIVQFADYQGGHGQFSQQKIYRHDDNSSTYLMQQVSEEKLPFIMQTISIEHK